MELIVVHGPPASGKFTIAQTLSQKLGYKLLHNHLTVDLALQVYPEFGGDDFFQFVDSLRSQCIQKACENQQKGLILTLCYDTKMDPPLIQHWQNIVQQYQGKLVPIYLDVPEAELQKRVVADSRKGGNKLQCQQQLQQVLNTYSYGPTQQPKAHIFATGDLSTEQSVALIMQRLFE